MLKFNEPDLDFFIKQPSNVITAISYLIVGLLVFSNDKPIGILIFILTATTVFFHAKNTLLGQWLDISSIIILIVALIIKGYPFSNISQSYFFLGVTLILVGEVFWIIDIKKLKIIPQNHVLTGHGIWHILTAISVWFIFKSI